MSGNPIARSGLVLLLTSGVLSSCAPVQQLRSVASSGSALIDAIAQTETQPQLSAAELRLLQAREFATTRPAAFASVMTVLLDSGYRILTADLDSGLVTATASTTGRLRLDPGGVARASETPLASVFVEDRPDGSVRVRVSFSIGRSATGSFSATGERAVTEAEPYAIFFAQLAEEIAQRPAQRTGPLRETSAKRVSLPEARAHNEESVIPPHSVSSPKSETTPPDAPDLEEEPGLHA